MGEPLTHVPEQLCRGQRAAHEQGDADEQPGRALGGDVEHDHEQAEEQRRGTDVGLEDQDEQARPPRDEHGPEVPRPGQVDAQDPAPGQRQHVPLGDQVAGEENSESELGELARLDREPADADPHLGAVDLAHRVGQDRGDGEQHQADRAEGVGVALQRPRLLDHGEHDDERGHANCAPHDLERRGRRGHRGDRVARVPVTAGLLQPVDHHDAQAVEQRGKRQQQRIRPRRQPPDGEVRDADDDRERQAVGDYPAGQLAVQPEAHAGVGEQHHGDGEDKHDQLGSAPAARQRHHAAQGRAVRHPPRLSGIADRAHGEPPELVAGAGQLVGMLTGVSLGFCGGWCTLPFTFTVPVLPKRFLYALNWLL